MTRKADIITRCNGSIWSFQPNSRKGKAWLSRFVDEMAGQGNPVHAEARYAFDLAMGAMQAGLRLQDAETGRFARGAA